MRDITVDRLALESGVTVVDPKILACPELEVGQDSVILPGCYLVGNLKAGSNCRLGPDLVTDGRVTLGDNVVAAQSLIVNSEIGDGCRIGPFAHIREGSVLLPV